MSQKLLNDRRQKVIESGKEARKFLDVLLDPMSFVETDTFICSQTPAGEAVGEGVISGYGLINDNSVYVYIQNSQVLKGALGELHAKKIVKTLTNADKADAPVISIIDCQGARIDEGIEALEGYGAVLGAAAQIKVPHICIVKGASYGMITVLAQLADFILLCKDSVSLTNSPLVISGGGNDAKDLGSAKMHAEVTGLADFVGDESECIAQAKKIVDYLYNIAVSDDDANRLSAVLNDTVEPAKIIEEVFDKGTFIESIYGAAKGVRTGLAQLDGITVGVAAIGSSETYYLNNNDLKKLARWVRICDFLNIPFINFVNTYGVVSSIEEEIKGLAANMGDVISAYAQYDNVKISVICGSAVGFGYSAFCSKGMGYDYTLAWPDAKVSMLPDESMALIVYEEQLKQAYNAEEARKKLAAQYNTEHSDVYFTALKGYVDNIIEPSHTRLYLISVLGMRL